MEFVTNYDFYPLTKDRWQDFEKLFGPHGAYGGCWCMWWRLSRKEFEEGQGGKNKQSMKDLVFSGIIPGILAYSGTEVTAWCSVAPREQYASLNRSRILKPLDELAVWSIVCFFVAKKYRAQGTLLQLIEGVKQYVRNQGGKVIEAYPTIPRSDNLPPVSSFMGLPHIFMKAGFHQCAQPSPSKMIMRFYL